MRFGISLLLFKELFCPYVAITVPINSTWVSADYRALYEASIACYETYPVTYPCLSAFIKKGLGEHKIICGRVE